ncbi:MAG: hypothetical protein ACFBRM_09945 [Pikeienuella sp.]
MKATTIVSILGGALMMGTGIMGTGALAQDTSPENVPEVAEFADRVTKLAESELVSWIADPAIIDAIKEQNDRNEGMSADDIAALDAAWRAETDARAKPMIWDLLDRLHSILLRDRRESSDGVVTEIIVMDKYGLNAAISDATSDFYQGDELKYSETYLVGPDAIFVDEYEFDESTQKWQTQVSRTVVDPETGDVIGAVTFGIDLTRLPE